MPTESDAVLVCGGAGYIGSHACKQLAREGFRPVVFDNLSTGHRWAVRWGPLIEGDVLDGAALDRAFAEYEFKAVMHFAAKSVVGESVRKPLEYMRNNVVGTFNLIEAMNKVGVRTLVFSSTAAVYGEPAYTPIDEDHPTRPINPYGMSKFMAELAIRESCIAGTLGAVCLRYFNAAGADLDCEIGESHEPETHLIPRLIKAALDADSGPATIYGNNYPTFDGTCIRDYVHVQDLAAAHVRALRYAMAAGDFSVFNIGSGDGHSVAEVVGACQRQFAGLPNVVFGPRRQGDPVSLVADVSRARDILNFSPRFSLAEIVSTAARWERNAPRAASA